MGIFGGGSSNINTSTQRISSFQVNQSSYGAPIKLIFGTAMVSAVLSDYVDFTAIAHTTTTHSGGKGGGGGATQTNTEYTYTVAGCMVLGEGEIAAVGKIWAGSKTTDLGAMNLTLFKGTKGQAPWGYMKTKHPNHALTYSGTAYVAGVVDLGSSASLPNMNFEVYGLCQSTKSSVVPTNQKMQQFAYTKEIEISNFQANRYVQEYVFNPKTAIGSWVTLDSKYYTIEQSKDAYDNPKYGVYTYTFNFDERDDGAERPDPTYVRIYYTAIQATVDYTPTDANPRDIIYTLLTSTVYGENFPDVLIDEEALAVYSQYCKANQLLISPVYADQTSCSDIISSLMECTNSEYVYSQGKVKIIPYWDGLPPCYAITDTNIINQDEETLRIERTSQADTYNIVPLEHTSRADQYNSNVVYATDEGDIELHGVRQAGTYSHPEIMNQSLAQAVAQLILQKQLYNRNRYTVKLGQEFICLEPMDAVTLESQLAGLGITSVRVVEIVESQEDFTLEITFEDNLSGITTAPDYETQEATRAEANTNAEPQNVNPLIIFEAPTPLVESATGYEVWIYASGNNDFWGGCNIWISTDNESYKMIGSVKQPARQGVLTEDFSVSSDAFKADFALSRSEINSVSQEAFDTYETISWISGAGNGEFLAYRDAELTGQYQYDVSTLHRGLYGSTAASHTAGATFIRCDRNTVLKYPFNAKDIGTTVYVKATSFNVFGTVEQELADVEPITFTIYGYNKKTIVESGTATINRNNPTRITYKNVFSAAPAPQVTITDAKSGDSLQIENMTETGFDCYFTNASVTTPTTRTINYLVTGV